jgi:Zn-dependent protease with chaperone function
VDFSRHQDDARKATRTLILGYLLAIAVTISILYLGWQVAEWAGTLFYRSEHAHPLALWDPVAFAWVAGGVLALVLGGSVIGAWQLKDGGPGLALRMGAEFVGGDDDDPEAKRLRNIVEEMSIASGVPAPAVFVLEQAGLNALAAGWDLDDAAVVVTRGALRALTRDELQAVVAHEFSHILHGDMRLNVLLMTATNGLMLISNSGFALLFGDRGLSRRSRGGGGAGHPLIFGVGIVLVVGGSLGALLGNLVKAAVSRQREYLADASAVQFTRNPSGLSGALKKILAASSVGRLHGAGVAFASHMFLDDPVRDPIQKAVFATHPPLDDRIRRVEPGWDGRLPTVDLTALGIEKEPELPRAVPARAVAASLAAVAVPPRPSSLAVHRDPTRTPRATPAAGPPQDARSWETAVPGLDPDASITLHAADLVGRSGAVDPSALRDGAELLASVPEPLRDAARSALGAVGIVYALALDRRGEIGRKQLAYLQLHAEREALMEAWRLAPMVQGLPRTHRLPLLGLCAPALRSMSKAQAEGLSGHMKALVHADGEVELYEFALHRILLNILRPVLKPFSGRAIQFYSLRGLTGEATQLLSWLAWAGASSPEDAQPAYDVGAARLLAARGTMPPLRPRAECRLEWLEDALDRLALSTPIVRAQVMDGCAHTVLADGEVKLAELELLRAVAWILAVPMPPLDAVRA